MAKLSLCMIVRDEEETLARCLDCAKGIADEIVIVDTGSTDGTVAIAKEYTDKVYSFEWIDDFAAARNFSFSKATMDYVMWLDADDCIDEKDRAELSKLVQELDGSVDVVMMLYNVAFDEFGNPTMSYYRERILKRGEESRWFGEVHEAIAPYGNTIYKDIAIRHDKIREGNPRRNLEIYRKMIADGKKFEPRQKFYYARELFHNKHYADAVGVFYEFLNDGNGWIENNIQACADLASCFYEVGDRNAALASLLRSFIYDTPRPEICCQIGLHFLNGGQCDVAIYWYERALSSKPGEQGFMSHDYNGFLPCIQLCVCYDRLKDYKKAYLYNEMAGKLKPGHPSYVYNKEYLDDLMK